MFSGTFMSDWFALIVSWVKDQCWITLDINTINFISGGIHLSNDEVIDTGKSLGELIPDWSELLAVTTPWGVVLDQNIVLFIHNYILEIISDNFDDSFLFSWDWFTFQIWLNFSSSISVIESHNTFLSNFLSLELWLHFIFFISIWHKKSNCWHHFSLNTKEISETLTGLILDISPGKKYTFLEFSGSLLKGSSGSLAFLIFFHKQENGLLFLDLENAVSGIIVELHDRGKSVSIDEGFHVSHVELAIIIVSSFVKLLK